MNTAWKVDMNNARIIDFDFSTSINTSIFVFTFYAFMDFILSFKFHLTKNIWRKKIGHIFFTNDLFSNNVLVFRTIFIYSSLYFKFCGSFYIYLPWISMYSFWITDVQCVPMNVLWIQIYLFKYNSKKITLAIIISMEEEKS